MTKQARSATQTPKTVRLLDVATLEEIHNHPLRSLIALADRVLDEDILANILETFEDDAYCRLVTVLEAPKERSSEEWCRKRLVEFADAMGDPGPFFDLLNTGQIQLARQIGNLVAGQSRIDPTLTYAPCGLSVAPSQGTLVADEAHRPRMTPRQKEKDMTSPTEKKVDPRTLPDDELAREIQGLERGAQPWGIPSSTSADRALLERMRAEQVRRDSPQSDGGEDQATPREPSPPVRAMALSRAVDQANWITLEVADLQQTLTQGGIHIGLLPDLRALVDQVAAQVREEAVTGAPSGDPSGRNLRYLSDDEHQFLERAARHQRGLTFYQPISTVPDRMAKAGLVDLLPIENGKRRAKITPPGRRAVQTWRYEVPTG